MTWTNDDFRTVFAALRDYQAILADPSILDRAVREILTDEAQEAQRALARIVDGLEGAA